MVSLAVSLAVAFVALVLVPAPVARADAALDASVAHALEFAGGQLARADAALPASAFPHVTSAAGAWETTGAAFWTSGYFAGTAWLMYEATGDDRWLRMARARQAGVAAQAANRATQDVGVMIGASFGNDLRLTGDAGARQVVRDAALSLATRWNATVGSLRSWNSPAGAPASDFWVIVDGLINLELLRVAAANGGDPGYAALATQHALTTRANHLRADGSTFHIVVYDSTTGAVKRKTYGPGYSASSTWSRGQAWAIHGFTQAYARSRDARLLDAASRAADFWLARVPADGVPYWDFDAPQIPNEPRDSSAAAIAASGLLALSQQPVGAERAAAYRAAAERVLRSLTSPAYLAEGTSNAAILQHGTSYKATGLIDRGLIYGDYYFLEALIHYRALGAMSAAQPASQLPSAGGDKDNDGIPDLLDTSDASVGPTVAKTVVAQVVSGDVFVRLPRGRSGRQAPRTPLVPAGYTALKGAQIIPLGSILHTTRGRVALTAVARASAGGRTQRTQRAEFSRGIFQVRQRLARAPLTDIALRNSKFMPACKSGRRRSRNTISRLWGNGRGRFRTIGRHSAATVRGPITQKAPTRWLTEERCSGTLTRVTRGVVSVRDVWVRRMVTLRAGRSYLARAVRSSATARRP